MTRAISPILYKTAKQRTRKLGGYALGGGGTWKMKWKLFPGGSISETFDTQTVLENRFQLSRFQRLPTPIPEVCENKHQKETLSIQARKGENLLEEVVVQAKLSIVVISSADGNSVKGASPQGL